MSQSPTNSSPGRRRHRRVKPQDESTKGVIDRAETTSQLGGVFAVIAGLRDEKEELILQFETKMKTNRLDEARYQQELAKSRADTDELANMLRMCSDGIDQKSTAHIPELPEAAVAKVVPAALQNMLEQAKISRVGLTANLQVEVNECGAVVDDCQSEYIHVAEATKCLLWDVERLGLIIQAYEADLAHLIHDGSRLHAETSAKRVLWRKKFGALRKWQDAVRRAHVDKYQAQLDEAIDALEAEMDQGDADLAGLIDMIGSTKMRDNKAKLTLFMKKMKNVKKYSIWRGWHTVHLKRAEEARAAELALLEGEYGDKIRKMKDAETNAMLKMFMKRWQNMKIAVPFSTWADIIKAKREARRLSALDDEKRRLMEALAGMADSEMMQRLKMHFARLAGKITTMCFSAMKKHAHAAKMAKFGDDERFKRLKTILAQKLKGVKYVILSALKSEAKQQKALRLKNSTMAQKLAAFLEMKVKGVNYAIMSAFKRNAVSERAERAEQERLASLIAESDNEALKRLKIYLKGKDFTSKYTTFRWWLKCTKGAGMSQLQRALDAKRAARAKLQEQLSALESQLAGGNPDDLKRQIALDERSLNAAMDKTESLRQEKDFAKNRFTMAEKGLAREKENRKALVEKVKNLTSLVDEAYAKRETMQKEVAIVEEQISSLHGHIDQDELRR